MASVLRRKLASFLVHWRAYGSRGALRLVRAKMRQPKMPALQSPGSHAPQALLNAHFAELGRFPTFRPPEDGGRISIVTDSVGKDSLFGGVATAVIIAAVTARETGRRLRLITRHSPPDAGPVRRILAANDIVFTGNIELAHAPITGGRSIDVTDGDRFLSTSWWTTRATIESVGSRRTAYLLQEDERHFYPVGDQYLRAEQTMRDPALKFVVNSALLYRHLVDAGFGNIAEHGVWFEPAFSRSLFHPVRRTGPMRLGFYARPNNVRNLFWRGLEALDRATKEGLFPASEWEFVFVGKDVPTGVTFDSGIAVHVVDSVPMDQYAATIRTLDVGLALMATPHPSYPPLDMAACGCTVVTNRYGLKTSLDAYADDIIASELGVEALVDALRMAEQRAVARRAGGVAERSPRLSDSWDISVRPATAFLTEAWADVRP